MHMGKSVNTPNDIDFSELYSMPSEIKENPALKIGDIIYLTRIVEKASEKAVKIYLMTEGISSRKLKS